MKKFGAALVFACYCASSAAAYRNSSANGAPLMPGYIETLKPYSPPVPREEPTTLSQPQFAATSEEPADEIASQAENGNAKVVIPFGPTNVQAAGQSTPGSESNEFAKTVKAAVNGQAKTNQLQEESTAQLAQEALTGEQHAGNLMAEEAATELTEAMTEKQKEEHATSMEKQKNKHAERMERLKMNKEKSEEAKDIQTLSDEVADLAAEDTGLGKAANSEGRKIEAAEQEGEEEEKEEKEKEDDLLSEAIAKAQGEEGRMMEEENPNNPCNEAETTKEEVETLEDAKSAAESAKSTCASCASPPAVPPPPPVRPAFRQTKRLARK